MEGAGLPRTGTLSMKSALTTLLKGKCYHMAEYFMGSQVNLSKYVIQNFQIIVVWESLI